MNIRPSKEEAKRLSQTNNIDLIPVSKELLSDFITPIEAMRILKNVSKHCFLLESAKANESFGRYTFLGYDPKLEITCLDGKMKVGDVMMETSQPSYIIRDLLKNYKSIQFDYLPPFSGGLVGYFSYDYLKYKEPTVGIAKCDNEEWNDVDLMLFDKVICFDNLTQKMILIVNIKVNEIDTAYEKALIDLDYMEYLLKNGKKSSDLKGELLGDIQPLFTKEQFVSMVNKAKYHIHEGDIFQIVLSNRLAAPFSGSLFDTYRNLRTINPSPYMFYFSSDDLEVAGASPETLVKLEKGVLHTFPLAGTRKRGKNIEEDLQLEKELLEDEKELAEHNMLVDLGRNDLGKISKFGSVEVEKFHSIERFSHVMHIGSTVKGIIDEKYDALDAIEAVLPAGTLSGAPKIRACQLINELEGNKRGIYGGAIGYIDFTGNMDTCIAIRIAYKKNNQVYVRSGAGIVDDSVPEKEYEECLNKAKSSLTALLLTKEM